jgi:NAD(P)-dependent dehydrogenase (short-subunit alcohol dehydrogenase family)
MQTWFITGTSSGFGRSLTEQLLARGDRVVATLRTPSRLDDLTARYGPDQLWVRALDVTDTAEMRAVVDAAWADLGRIDVVISNAGNGVLGSAEELSDAHIEQVVATNLVGSMQLARAVLPHLRAQGGGRILQLSSMGGQMSFPGFSLYHASKWGIEGFYDALAPEVEPFSIRTTLVEPGVIRTPFFATAVREPEHPAYADHPNIARDDIPLDAMPGDMDKVARAMIELGLMADPPRRQLLGTDAYNLVHDALTARLAEVEAGRETASTTDRTAAASAA